MLPQHLSTSNERYTPPYIIERARAALGGIDLDPASCGAANSIVRAKRYYTREEDGINKLWVGKVWLNPPYGYRRVKDKKTPQAGLWVDRLIGLYDQGFVTHALLLVNANFSSDWFKPLWRFRICCLYDRIKFLDADLITMDQPAHSNVIIALGISDACFIANFGDIGAIVHAVNYQH